MVVAGIDVGAEAKGFHVVVLRGTIAECFHRRDVAEVVALCTSAQVVAIDAPGGWALPEISPCGRSRLAERTLKARRGITSFCTPTRSRALAHSKGFYTWTFNGEKLWQALRSPCGATTRLIETFPHGVACALRGQRLRAADKRHDRGHLLRQLGYRLPPTATMDHLDACLCAHAAARFAAGDFEEFGHVSEGCIVLPAWRRPRNPEA